VPEGDTIWRTAAALRSRLAGRRVESAEPDSLRRLTGSVVTAVEPVGKHLFIRFDSGLALHTHMRMTGSWHLYRPGQAWQKPARQAKAVLHVADAVAVLFSAPVVELVREPQSRSGHLGPDILADDFGVSAVVTLARTLGPMPAGELLLDQRVASGIGNIWRCETLWQRRVNPWTSSGSLSDGELADLYRTARRLMQASVKRLPGGPRAVHGRAGRPCRHCGAPIHFRAQGRHARMTYWCPTCQPPGPS
jgi:endonuclease-8